MAADGITYDLSRRTLDDGAVTTVYATRHPRGTTRVRAVHFAEPERLDVWCAAHGTPEAIIGGFFLRASRRPPASSTPTSRWAATRARRWA
jgi:hypothetical protein